MMFDDRLATVLRSPLGGDRAARTQFRQLLDLLGSAPGETQSELAAPAYVRLKELAARISAEEQSHILREPGLRLRNRDLVAFLAEGEAKPAAAALATARLSDHDWQDLIPALPIVARGFLRHRRDLPPGAKRVLERLGVRDFVLPRPTMSEPAATDSGPPSPPPAAPSSLAPQPVEPGKKSAAVRSSAEGIRSLLERIEAFRSTRQARTPAPRLPLGDAPDDDAALAADAFEFTSDSEGRIDWASGALAPLAEGMRLDRSSPGIVAVLEDSAARRMRQLQPLDGARLVIDASPAISGDWRVDAYPYFTGGRRQFAGYRGRIRRPVFAMSAQVGENRDSPADRMRQVLHELRTPVNAIQGFAEIIQQQLFGPAPNEYRALAAAVSVDAAKLLAAFEELDRLTRLETGALELDAGEGDMREVVVQTLRRLEGALRPRNAGLDLEVEGSPFATGLAREELLVVCWRILATLAGSLAPAERVPVRLRGDGASVTLEVGLPRVVAEHEDPLAVAPEKSRPAISAGMFGTGYSLRLARAEIIAAGGEFEIGDETLIVSLPVLTGSNARHSTVSGT